MEGLGGILACFVFLHAMKHEDNTRAKISLIIGLIYENQKALNMHSAFLLPLRHGENPDNQSEKQSKTSSFKKDYQYCYQGVFILSAGFGVLGDRSPVYQSANYTFNGATEH
jgi:hypothetical protein